MRTASAAALLVVSLVAGAARAQPPTGTIAGVVTDSSGAAVPGVQISITNRETGQIRSVTTSTEGRYGVEALPPGSYEIAAEVSGFKRAARAASVEAGTSTAVNLVLEIGDVSETMTVVDATPLLRHDHHQVAGGVNRDQIENLPLNGRNFLELARLEPGVTNPTRLTDGRTFVSSLGSGLQTIPRVGYTRMTVDGGNVSTPTTIGTIFQVSQDVVQEFQIATVNFDVATSLTSNGAINIVTRSGGNAFHGTGFFLHRGHRLAAYPALRRDPSNPDPAFERNQFGASAGGPIRTNQLFFFAGYERHDQQGVVSVQPLTPEFAALGGIFASPYVGNLFSARVDARIGPHHNAFVRYTHDGNRAFEGATAVLPSGWARRTKQVDQSLAAVTSVLSARVVNDFRVSYLYLSALVNPADPADCPGCVGVGAPRIIISGAGLALGMSNTTTFVTRRLQLSDNLAWQLGDHRVHAGFDWEHATGSGSSLTREPAQITVWSPERVSPAIPLPSTFATVEDVLQLPLRSFETGVGSGTVTYRDFRPDRVLDQYRLYISDTWRIGHRLTMNAGLAWSYEPHVLNDDLTKPALLVPILGDRLKTAPVQTRNFSPTLGFAWTATGDGKTVVRGGAGRYFDPVGSTNAVNLESERAQLSPAGTGRLIVSGRNILRDGRPLDFPRPTSFRAVDLLPLLPGIRAELLQSIDPRNRDFSVRNIDLAKEGENLYDPAYATPYAIHASLGVQRELASGFAVSADLVWRRFVHTFINGIDYNRWDSAGGPVIRACAPEERDDVRAVCSNGSLFFDTTIGRATYRGVLVRLDKRFSGRTQFLVSYALGSYVGTNGTGTGTSEAAGGRVFGFNNDDWFENYGPLPTDLRHVLNVSGYVDLPWQFRAAAIASAYSRPPFSPYVAGVDFNGDGTENDLLPGTRVNQFGRGLNRADMERLVERYNQEFPGKLTLPFSYSLNDNFFALDLRVSRSFILGGGRARLTLLGEVFNLLNIANLVGHGSNLASPASFGQPNARFNQVFGSGGPRAAQLGAKITF